MRKPHTQSQIKIRNEFLNSTDARWNLSPFVSYVMVTAVHCLGKQRPERVTNHPPSVEFKNTWSSTSRTLIFIAHF